MGNVILFAILFVWQFPHFFSIAWLYREDYAAVEFACCRWSRRWTLTRAAIVAYSLILIPLSVLPSVFGMAGKIYMVGAVVLGIRYFISERDSRS